PTFRELVSPEFVATSPPSLILLGSYLPFVLYLGSVESKLSDLMLFPFMSILPSATSPLVKMRSCAARTRTPRARYVVLGAPPPEPPPKARNGPSAEATRYGIVT